MVLMSECERNYDMLKNARTGMYIKMEPNKLYPLSAIASVEPKILQRMVKLLAENADIYSIKSFVYKGNMYMIDGNYEMLAANILNKKSVDVEIVERKDIPFWNIDKNLEENLQAIGISTLYDFETVGGFTYDKYPAEYKRR